jgi:CRISPR/Cas system endoribonuclease Cas6 (RAMP superfamily)
MTKYGYRWITRLRLKQYLQILNERVAQFNKERLMRSMFIKWIKKRDQMQVQFYTEKIANGKYRFSLARKALSAWKVRVNTVKERCIPAPYIISRMRVRDCTMKGIRM